jgi:hypothetical protein
LIAAGRSSRAEAPRYRKRIISFKKPCSFS